MRAIIIASSKGERLGARTADRPPCMVEVGGRPVLHHQLEALRFWGIDDVVVIRGHRGEAIAGESLRFVDDDGFADHGSLASLFRAGPELVGDVLISAGDVVYQADAVAALLRSQATGALLVDRRWRARDKADEQVDLCRSTRDGLVLEVGRTVRPQGTLAAFVGLARFRAPMTARLWAAWERALARGDHLPLGASSSLRSAGFVDMVHELVDRGDTFSAVQIDGGWRGLESAPANDAAAASS